MATTYDIGDIARISGTFSQGGSAIDPSVVSLIVRAPDGTLTTYVYGTDAALVRTATGAFRLDYSLIGAAPGVYRYRWVSTGTGQAAQESWFEVRPNRAS